MAKLYDDQVRPVTPGEHNIVNYLASNLKDNYHIFPNKMIFDMTHHQHYETDVIVVSNYNIYLIEIKDWQGKIVIDESENWFVNDCHKRNVHLYNKFKIGKLREYLIRKCLFNSNVFDKHFFRSIFACGSSNAELLDKTVKENSPAEDTPKISNCQTPQKIVDYILLTDNFQANKKAYFPKGIVEKITGALNSLSKNENKNKIINGYELKELIFDHHYYREYSAVNLSTKKYSGLQLIKEYNLGGYSNSEEREKLKNFFEREIEILEKLGYHPNIVRYLTTFNNDDSAKKYVIFEYPESKLSDQIKKKKINFEAIETIVFDIIDGLEFLHSNNIIHRTLCPDNIYSSANKYKIMNFDKAFILEGTTQTVWQNISDDFIKEISAYLPPELSITAENGTLSEASDIYSLGIILYELLTGRKPFSSSEEYLTKYSSDFPNALLPSIITKNNELLPFNDIIKKMVAYDPVSRYVNIKDLKNDLIKAFKCEEEKKPKFEVNQLLNANDEFGPYKVIEYIGKGASAQIYHVVDSIKNANYILKLFNHEEKQETASHEYDIINSLSDHPNIPHLGGNLSNMRFFTNRDNDDRYYLYYDYITGYNLQEYPEKFDEETFVKVFKKLAEIIFYVHSKNIIHGDIKPANIIFSIGIIHIWISINLKGNYTE
ncbi:MAG: Serine/threonine-protein kinase PknB [bacterium ADurb.Bin363]|nr:MAG: Serine/threonine-protein kinase PknB [bacterium ADurb.Bin363]